MADIYKWVQYDVDPRSGKMLVVMSLCPNTVYSHGNGQVHIDFYICISQQSWVPMITTSLFFSVMN